MIDHKDHMSDKQCTLVEWCIVYRLTSNMVALTLQLDAAAVAFLFSSNLGKASLSIVSISNGTILTFTTA